MPPQPAALSNAVWGIDVEDDSGRVLFARNAHTLIIPASNRKIFASSSALNCYGADHRFTTELWIDGSNLVIRGGGDPGLGGRWAYDRDAVFATFVAALQARGVTAVDDIIADVSAFDRVTIPDSWETGDIGYYYAAPVDALAYNENVVGVTVEHCESPVVQTDPPFVDGVERVTCGAGAPTVKVEVVSDENVVVVAGPMAGRVSELRAVASPPLYAAQALREALRHAGVSVRGTLRVNIDPKTWPERVAVIESQPLWHLLTLVLKNSQNLYAEMLFKGTAGTYVGAADLERDFLTNDIGIDGSEFRFVDGSGLSANDLVTPAAIVKMFRWMNAAPRRGLFWMLLATPGEEGTLRRRLVELAPRLRGKTGTINGVNALSGIVVGRSGGYRYFSVVLNHHIADSPVATRAIDDIVSAIADF